jgi:SAM-dependent methyltransferase
VAVRPNPARTVEIIARWLPSPPGVIADLGGGPGRYAIWLAERGYRVQHRDIVPLHVEQTAAATAGYPAVTTAVGDARDVDLDEASVDAVLLLGPLYHLADRRDRVRALGEARRVVRPGGPRSAPPDSTSSTSSASKAPAPSCTISHNASTIQPTPPW